MGLQIQTKNRYPPVEVFLDYIDFGSETPNSLISVTSDIKKNGGITGAFLKESKTQEESLH